MSHQGCGLGVIGCGGFGLFALQHFVQVPGVHLIGLAGTHRPAAFAAARRFAVRDVTDVATLLDDPDVDLVYIATPPFLHFEQSLQALTAGKHVLVEKPMALTPAQADRLTREAAERDLLVVTNLMQRYNPLFRAIRQLIEAEALGTVLHGYFENYAADEGLEPNHWFWDPRRSGGIFVEHAVHFFDLFQGWLGAGQVVAAQRTLRPDNGVEEQVQCTVRYASDCHVNFYHGFHQPGRLDRQELRLVFERGDVTLQHWIPTSMRLRAIVDERQTRTLCDIFPTGRLDVSEVYPPAERACRSRHKSYDVSQMIELTDGLEDRKMHRYGDLLRELMADQLAWIRDRRHRREVTEQNGRDSLRMATDASRLAASADSRPEPDSPTPC